MLVKCERDAKLADTAILAMDSTTARLNAPYNSLFRGFAPIFPDTCYHLTHYWPAAADIPV
ncbi:hypothetical protein NP258_08920, partial [Salmonella enterica]|nr:hypothetical protein [Salmonella enterica]